MAHCPPQSAAGTGVGRGCMGSNGVGSGFRYVNALKARPKPSSMARAIRGALALTTVALAMSGSGTAFAAAGVCSPATPTAGQTVDCDGTFATPINFNVDDLTVVIG